jgi:hypothetical protein
MYSDDFCDIAHYQSIIQRLLIANKEDAIITYYFKPDLANSKSNIIHRYKNSFDDWYVHEDICYCSDYSGVHIIDGNYYYNDR